MSAIDAQYVKSLRQQHGYVCPLCMVVRFPADDALFAHIRQIHPDEPVCTENERGLLRRKALYRSLGSGAGKQFAASTLRSSNVSPSRDSSTGSMRNNADPVSRSMTPVRTSSADPTAAQIARLSLEQADEGLITPDTTVLLNGANGQSSPSRKRPADSEINASKRRSPSAGVIAAQVSYLRDRKATSPNSSRTVQSQRTSTRPTPHQKQLYDHRHPSQPNTIASPGPQSPSTASRPKSVSMHQHVNAPTPTQSPLTPMKAQSLPRGILPIPHSSDQPYPMLKQPESRQISQDQLTAEIKGIHAGLVIVETKCKNVDRAQTSVEGRKSKPTAADWQAFTALHRTLLYEHHDFLLASQHPAAPPSLRLLASEYHMPVRMWKHAIHSYLEVLRQHLPESLDFMLNFIYLAYQMMALLYETVEAFKDTWTECLGDLARYRMAIENEDPKDRDTWSNVARSWYSRASDRNPSVGRLYHHLGILARPHALQQLFYYCKSLTAVYPFWSARESIVTLFDPLLGISRTAIAATQSVDVAMVNVHALMFASRPVAEVRSARAAYCAQIDSQVDRVKGRWREHGSYVAIANVSAWFEYGSQQNPMRLLYSQDKKVKVPRLDQTMTWLANAIDVTFHVLLKVLQRLDDRNVLPHVHIVMVFLNGLCLKATADPSVHAMLAAAPWRQLALYLAELARIEGIGDTIHNAGLAQRLPVYPKGDARPLPEDHFMRGLVWCQPYFARDWFADGDDEEGRLLELPSSGKMRAERVLWLGICIAKRSEFLRYDVEKRSFTALPQSKSTGQESTAAPQFRKVEATNVQMLDSDHPVEGEII